MLFHYPGDLNIIQHKMMNKNNHNQIFYCHIETRKDQ